MWTHIDLTWFNTIVRVLIDSEVKEIPPSQPLQVVRPPQLHRGLFLRTRVGWTYDSLSSTRSLSVRWLSVGRPSHPKKERRFCFWKASFSGSMLNFRVGGCVTCTPWFEKQDFASLKIEVAGGTSGNGDEAWCSMAKMFKRELASNLARHFDADSCCWRGNKVEECPCYIRWYHQISVSQCVSMCLMTRTPPPLMCGTWLISMDGWWLSLVSLKEACSSIISHNLSQIFVKYTVINPFTKIIPFLREKVKSPTAARAAVYSFCH